MNSQFITLIGDNLFINRRNNFNSADVVLYHPGHYSELNEKIINLYKEETFKKIMIPNVYNNFLNEDEYLYHKNLLVELGLPENMILPIKGDANSANDIIRNAINQLDEDKDRKILLAGKTFFINRFLLIASAYAKDDMVLDVLPLEDHRGITKENWYLNEGSRDRVLNEYHKISQFFNENSETLFNR